MRIATKKNQGAFTKNRFVRSLFVYVLFFGASAAFAQTMINAGLYNKNGKGQPMTYTLSLWNTQDTVTCSGHAQGDTVLYELLLLQDTVLNFRYQYEHKSKVSELAGRVKTGGSEALIQMSIDNTKVLYKENKLLNPYFQMYQALADSVFLAADSLKPGYYPYLQLVNNCEKAIFYPARHNNFCGDLKLFKQNAWVQVSNPKTEAIFWAYKLEPGMAIKGKDLYPRHINLPLVEPGKYRFDVYLVGEYVGSLEPEWPVPLKRRKLMQPDYYLCTQQFEVKP
ncbi:MAG: hypothetical protein JST26_20180 [Bacteroidetes bacterium]|nr:hypothetical protein [Bacteroidota bacterium]